MSNRWINNLLQNCIQFESMAALTADTDQTLYTFHPDLFNIGPIPKWLHGRMPGYCMDCHYRADACYCDWPAPICVTDPKCRVSVACGATPSMQWVSALCHSRNRGGGQDESPPCWNTPVQIHRCPPWYLMRQDSISCVDHVRPGCHGESVTALGVPHKCKQLNKNKPKKCLEIVLLRSLRRKMIPKSLRVEKCWKCCCS